MTTTHTLNPYLIPILDELDHCFSLCALRDEHQLIKHLQNKKVPPFEHLSLANTKDLFSAHFLCMHSLYHLKKRYLLEQNYTLDIQSVRIQRIALDEPEQNNINGSVALEASDPLEQYYLNAKHYFETQEEEITDLLKSFWQKYVAQDNIKQALAVLELPNNANAKMIKTQYLRLAQQHHPDKGGCADRFRKIREAKAVLDKHFRPIPIA